VIAECNRQDADRALDEADEVPDQDDIAWPGCASAPIIGTDGDSRTVMRRRL
jgi:hypothetical protein